MSLNQIFAPCKVIYFQKLAFSTSKLILKNKRSPKKLVKKKIGLPPKFIDNVKLWPQLIEAELETQFEKLNNMLRDKSNWKTIEERGLCVGNFSIFDTSFDPIQGSTTVTLYRNSERFPKWLKSYAPITLCRIREDGTLQILCDGNVVSVNNDKITIIPFKENRIDHSCSNYILMPCQNHGFSKHMREILENPDSLSSDSVHLINLAYRGIQMPSIHDRKISSLSEKLNESQVAAVSASLNQKRNFLCIQGPPGTGKTHVIAECISQLIMKKKKVLVCAPTHVAVRNAYAATAKKIMEKFDENKVGEWLLQLSESDEYFQRHQRYRDLVEKSKELALSDKNSCSYVMLLKMIGRIKYEINKEIYGKKMAIFSTLSSSVIKRLPNYEWNANVIIVDEAAQCTEPSIWVPVIATPNCQKLILVGDQKQLPAVVVSNEALKHRFNVSLMEKLSKEFADTNINILLKEQFRMNKKIMRWSNDIFYDSQLYANESVENITLNDIFPNLNSNSPLNLPIFMINMDENDFRTKESKEKQSFINIDEVDVVTNYVNRLIVDVGVDPQDIAVISPYYSQIEQLRRSIRFRDIGINTVDAFQGHERQIVVFCLVRDNPNGMIGFLSEIRRLNVAVTRAKRQFVLIGSVGMMKKNKQLKTLYKYLQNDNAIFGPDIIHEFDNVSLPKSTQVSKF